MKKHHLDLLQVVIDQELTGKRALRFAENFVKLPLDDFGGVVLRFNEESKLDTNGLAVLVRIYSQMEKRHKDFYVVGVSVDVSRALSRLGLAKVLNAPEVAKRPPQDTDPTLSVLTGAFPVVAT